MAGHTPVRGPVSPAVHTVLTPAQLQRIGRAEAARIALARAAAGERASSALLAPVLAHLQDVYGDTPEQCAARRRALLADEPACRARRRRAGGGER